ncbi:hypothetical protein HW555_000100 [Spodoptera exigua]|uniref:Uncharacterized protein n=1 Tax=Spodoptera exigua TaxID=7107 RepID=A0A835GSS4_SPOEX|nr:hypothetical protein HW555_000100 [Spodoptera exigua]
MQLNINAGIKLCVSSTSHCTALGLEKKRMKLRIECNGRFTILGVKVSQVRVNHLRYVYVHLDALILD